MDNWVGGKGDKGGDGGGKAVDYAEDAVMLQMEDDEIEAEAADDEEDSSGPSGYDVVFWVGKSWGLENSEGGLLFLIC